MAVAMPTVIDTLIIISRLLWQAAEAGRLHPGRYVNTAQSRSNLFLSMADRMGVRGVERFGDSTGQLTNV